MFLKQFFSPGNNSGQVVYITRAVTKQYTLLLTNDSDTLVKYPCAWWKATAGYQLVYVIMSH